MKITIVGAGRVGIHLAKYFADEHQDVFLIDNDRAQLSALESDFNLRTFYGEPIDFKTLREANTEKADIFVAVTADTATNLVICAMAKSMGAKKTIARVDKYDFLEKTNVGLIRNMGVDHVVYPDYLVALSVISSLEHSWCYGWNDFNDGTIVMAAITVCDDSPICGSLLKDMYKESRTMHISALKRGNRTIIPHGEDRIEPNDILYITTIPEGIGKVKVITGKEEQPIRKVILMGGSAVAELTVKLAGKRFSFVIVDKSLERCRKIAENCSDVEVIFGDGSEQDVLEEAGLNNCDAFVALSDSTEGNILGCLTAIDNGVIRTVAEIEKEQYIAKAESFGIGAIINKPIITANAIFQIILDSDQSSSKCFAMKDAEVAKMEIREGSSLTKQPVKELKLPKELTFAGLIRKGMGEIVTGNTIFEPGDSVIVFCLNGSLDKVEKLFKK
ncbi:MAG: Trk system potassium transporter TrkA [Muribaculaceae bacterium]|nr:Trk system potassium transporter TrkA [Muribaculaceae bacterium]